MGYWAWARFGVLACIIDLRTAVTISSSNGRLQL
jgi:hypothetical protein